MKAFVWNILKKMGTPDHPIYLMRNLYMGQEKQVRTLYETTDWFKIKEYDKAVYYHHFI